MKYDHLLSGVSHIVGLPKETAQTFKTGIDEAIKQMPVPESDSQSYDNVSVFSIYWKSDNTGKEDSSLFIQTTSKLQNIQSCQRGLHNLQISS